MEHIEALVEGVLIHCQKAMEVKMDQKKEANVNVETRVESTFICTKFKSLPTAKRRKPLS